MFRNPFIRRRLQEILLLDTCYLSSTNKIGRELRNLHLINPRQNLLTMILTCFIWARCWVVSPFIPARNWTKFFLSVVLQRKAKDKENAKSPVTTSTQALTPRDSLCKSKVPQVTRSYFYVPQVNKLILRLSPVFPVSNIFIKI